VSEPLPADQLAAVAALWSRAGRELAVRFTGASMEPAIASGAEVRLVCGAACGPGDVIAVRAGSGVLVHRVVAGGRKGQWILTRGDARLLPDPPARAADVIGRVTGRRAGSAFEDVPPAPRSLAGRVVLAPFVALMRASPAAGGALIAGLTGARRLLLRAAGGWSRA
jgi:hypothetical protein